MASVVSESPPGYPPDPPDELDLARLPRREATERLLALRQLATDDEERQRLQDRSSSSTSRSRVDVARRYRSRGVAIDDLEQVACLGLVKAVRGFDPERATDFLSYAVPTIRGEVRRYFRDHGWTVRPPRSVQQAQARITAVESDLCQDLGRAPRPSEIAERLGPRPRPRRRGARGQRLLLADVAGRRTDRLRGRRSATGWATTTPPSTVPRHGSR